MPVIPKTLAWLLAIAVYLAACYALVTGVIVIGSTVYDRVMIDMQCIVNEKCDD